MLCYFYVIYAEWLAKTLQCALFFYLAYELECLCQIMINVIFSLSQIVFYSVPDVITFNENSMLFRASLERFRTEHYVF